MDTSDLINQYVDVCNQALLINKDRFPFKQILGAARMAQLGSNIEVTISDVNDSGTFVFKLTHDGIVAKRHSNCGDCNCDRTWSVSHKYLESVSKNPQAYIQNPAQIDWEWMYSSKRY